MLAKGLLIEKKESQKDDIHSFLWKCEKEPVQIVDGSTTVFPGFKWPPFFFYLTTLILTNTIDV